MPMQATGDLLTVPIDHEQVKQDEYLSDVSPKHRPWDQHRGEADDVTTVFASSPFTRHHRYAERVSQCSQYIGFARDPPKNGKTQLKLKNARFCRVRFCPVCQWRRSSCGKRGSTAHCRDSLVITPKPDFSSPPSLLRTVMFTASAPHFK